MPPVQEFANWLLAFGGALAVVWGLAFACGFAWVGFASLLMLRAAVVAWRWLGVAEARVREQERKGVRGNAGMWRAALGAVYAGGVGVGLGLALLVIGQWSGFVAVGVGVLIAVIPLGLAIFDP